jgi:large subunit ribosomal protein L6
MSRIGKQPVALPAKVEVTVGDRVVVKGPKGSLDRPLVEGVDVKVEDGNVIVTRRSDSKQHRANHGLMRSLVNNMVTGVSVGFTKKLEIIGVGYKAEVKGRDLLLNLGFSHPITFSPPEGVVVTVDKQTIVALAGMDRESVGQAAAVIRSFRPPDSYKGKGVRYEGEQIRLKAGKAAKK